MLTTSFLVSLTLQSLIYFFSPYSGLFYILLFYFHLLSADVSQGISCNLLLFAPCKFYIIYYFIIANNFDNHLSKDYSQLFMSKFHHSASSSFTYWISHWVHSTCCFTDPLNTTELSWGHHFTSRPLLLWMSPILLAIYFKEFDSPHFLTIFPS